MRPLLLIWMLQEKLMLPCLSKQVLGIDCPGCGLQRSVAFLLKGEFAASFLMYPALLPMLTLFGFLALNRFVNFRKENTIIAVLGGLTVFSILANYIIKLLN
ncbi:DUF2752 domain-containing protein [Robiginitalea aurantiaca]|uniref:DUF2752 domain-containing protein n=1 Tax=Robiginitalea aurantiaca TaxID=3056915 RepID=A0ABT7WCV3_9FLAO|nr:DUF2752 domain-containing protein [Robiginitalea aurantiaca]MDM9630747.1 DUF2752 domain-containing protein [Robiginitalea aurantiaca]